MLQAELAAIDPALVPRAPLLAGLLDLDDPGQRTHWAFDAKLRKTSLEGLLVECLRARGRSEAPLVLVLEDCHWLDSAVAAICSRCSLVPLSERSRMLVLAYRPATDVGGGLGLDTLPHFDEIALAELDDAARGAADPSASSADARRPTTEAPAGLVELITARAQGNPFYIEELLNFIHSQGVDLHDEPALKQLELPGSLHSLILSRIDKLAEAPRRTLKVASVIGRVFRAPMLPGVVSRARNGSTRSTEPRGAWRERARQRRPAKSSQTYIFKHGVTQEVAYESMPFAFRSMLHERVGAYIEVTEADVDRSPPRPARAPLLARRQPAEEARVSRSCR